MLKSNDLGHSTAAVTAIDKMLDQFSGCLNAEAARRVVDFKIDSETQALVAALGEKANQGRITDEELDAYKSYVEVADFITILKLKAKQLLSTTNGA
jgi:hypothetical protein